MSAREQRSASRNLSSAEAEEEYRQRFTERSRKTLELVFSENKVQQLGFDELKLIFEAIKNSQINPKAAKRVLRLLEGDPAKKIAEDDGVIESAIYNSRKSLMLWVARHVGFEKITELLISEAAEAELIKLFNSIGSMAQRSKGFSPWRNKPMVNRGKTERTSSRQNSKEFWSSPVQPTDSGARFKNKKPKYDKNAPSMLKVVKRKTETRLVDGQKKKFTKVVLEGWDSSKRAAKPEGHFLNDTEKGNLRI